MSALRNCPPKGQFVFKFNIKIQLKFINKKTLKVERFSQKHLCYWMKVKILLHKYCGEIKKKTSTWHADNEGPKMQSTDYKK